MSEKTIPGLMPIWLLLLAVVLAVMVTIVAPIVAAPDPVKLSDWFGFAGSTVGAIVTLIAAWKAWDAVQEQIRQVEKLETKRRRQKLAALRAFLPLHLSQLSRFCFETAQALLKLHEQCIGEELPYTTGIAVPQFPDVAQEDARALAEFIEYSDDVSSSILQGTLSGLQILIARVQEVRSLVDSKAPGEIILKASLEQYIIDAATVYAHAASCFDYARHRAEYLPEKITWDGVRGALRNMKIWDEVVPAIFETISRLEEANSKP